MKRLLAYLKRKYFHPENRYVPNDIDNNNSKISILDSWELSKYVDVYGEEVKPHWKEVWSFAAIDDAETNGVYVCDYINLHSVVGRWELKNNRLRLLHKEYEREYILVESPNEQLILKPIEEGDKETLIFKRVV